MKLSGRVEVLVKLQRPPPEMAIFFPTRSACSITKTLRPRLPAWIAQKRPAAPAPMIITSHSCIGERVQQTGLRTCDLCDPSNRLRVSTSSDVKRRIQGRTNYACRVFWLGGSIRRGLSSHEIPIDIQRAVKDAKNVDVSVLFD